MAAENIDNTVNGTGLFPAKVPGLSDAADIQAALKLYHYGSYTYDGSNTNPANLVTPSIAKHLQNLVNADTAATAALAAHEADTTNIHGIVNTANLATQTYVNTAISSAVGGVTGQFSDLAGTAIDWNSVEERFDVEPRLANAGTVITKTESFILSASDVGKTAILYSSNPITVTLPANASVEIPVGYSIDIIQTGTGSVTVSEGSGIVAINSKSNIKSLDGQYSKGTLVKIDTNTWFFFGNLFNSVVPTPVTPTPVAPTPVAPTPVAPTPVAPTPVAPTPVAPTPVAPTPVAPTPVAPTPVAPTPVAPQLATPSLSVTSSGYNQYPNTVYANIGVGNYDYLNTYTTSSAGWTQNPEYPQEWYIENISPNTSQTVYITASRAGYTSATGSLTFTSHYVAPPTPTAPTPTSSATYIMPNVVGMTESAAASAINSVGINYEFTNLVNNANGATAQNTGTVKAQSPAAGTYAPELAGAGTGATLDVYNYTAAPTPTAPTPVAPTTTYYLAQATIDFQDDTCVSAPAYVSSTTTTPPTVGSIFSVSSGARTATSGYYSTVSSADAVAQLLAGTTRCQSTPTPVAPTPVATTGYYAYGCCNGDPLVVEGPNNATARADYQSEGGCTASGVSSTYTAALTGAQAACGTTPTPVAPTPTSTYPTLLSGLRYCENGDVPNPASPCTQTKVNNGECVNNGASGGLCPTAPTPASLPSCSSPNTITNANSYTCAELGLNYLGGSSVYNIASNQQCCAPATPTPVAPTPVAPTPVADDCSGNTCLSGSGAACGTYGNGTYCITPGTCPNKCNGDHPPVPAPVAPTPVAPDCSGNTCDQSRSGAPCGTYGNGTLCWTPDGCPNKCIGDAPPAPSPVAAPTPTAPTPTAPTPTGCTYNGNVTYSYCPPNVCVYDNCGNFLGYTST